MVGAFRGPNSTIRVAFVGKTGREHGGRPGRRALLSCGCVYDLPRFVVLVPGQRVRCPGRHSSEEAA